MILLPRRILATLAVITAAIGGGQASKAATVFWRGYIDGQWNTSSINWFSSGKGVAYQQNDSVVFDDSLTGGPNIVITTVVTPSSVTMNNTSARYSFGGSGKISGPTGISKNGSNLWILGETGGDDFTGGISVAGGTLFLVNANSAMSGGLSIASGATVLAGINDDRGSLPSGALVDNGTLTISRSNDVTISTSISGAGLINQNGDGALILTANNTFSGTIAVTDGTLVLTNSGSIPIANVTISNAKLNISGVSSGATTMVALGLTDSVLTLAATNQSIPPLTVTALQMGGSANTVNITTLPSFTGFPTTLPIVRAAAGISGYNAVLGSLPNGYAGNISLSSDTTEILLTLTSGPASQRTSEFWTGADVVNLNTNWSDNLNWQLPGKPATGDNVIFNNSGAQSASALASPGAGVNAYNGHFIDNIVDDNFTLSSLIYTNFGGFYHNTFINNGKTLSITNSAFNIGALDTGGTPQTQVVTIGGANGTLNVNSTNMNVQVWLGNANTSGANNQSTLDLSALGTFTATANHFLVGAAVGNSVDRPSGILYLALTNTLSAAFQTTNSDIGTDTGNAAIDIGDCNNNAGADSYLYLGLVNTISANTINLGRQKAAGHLLFNPIYANVAPYPSVTFQGYSGSRIALVEIANGVGNTDTTTHNADATLTGGMVNMSVDVLNIGRASGGTSGAGNTTGTLNFDAGTINANTVNIGLQPATGSKVGIGLFGVSSNTLIGSAATLVVNGSLNLGLTSGGVGAATSSGILNITNGTVSANSIVAGSNSVSMINLIGGRLTVATTIGNATAVLGTLNLASLNTSDNSNTVLQVPASLTPSVMVNNLNLDALDSTTNRINISSVAPITAPAELPVIHYTNLNLTVGGTFNLGLGTLPSGYTGYLTNDTTLKAIALVVTTAPPPAPVPPTIQSLSIIGGNVVLTGTNNSGAGGTFHVLTSTNIALPLSNWATVTNGTFDSSGNFNTTNAIDDPQSCDFYILQVP